MLWLDRCLLQIFPELMLDAILIGMTDVDGTLAFRSDLWHSLTGIMCGQFNHEIVYHRLFVTSPFMKQFVRGVPDKNVSWSRVIRICLILVLRGKVTRIRLILISWTRVTEFRLTLFSWNRATELRLTLFPRVRLSETYFEVSDLSDAAWNARQGVKPGNKLPRDLETSRGVLQGLNKALAFWPYQSL